MMAGAYQLEGREHALGRPLRDTPWRGRAGGAVRSDALYTAAVPHRNRSPRSRGMQPLDVSSGRQRRTLQPPGRRPVTSVAPPAGDPAPPALPTTPKTPESDVLASDSSPPGITKLSKEEGEAAQKTCKPLADALAAAAKKEKLAGATGRYAFVQQFLQNPPKLAHVDVAKCAEPAPSRHACLPRRHDRERSEDEPRPRRGRPRDVARARAAGSLRKRRAHPGRFGALTAGSWTSKAEDWSAPGWACARFNLAGEPQRFQYQLVTNAKAGTWEVIARGFPVKDGSPTELYAHGRIEDGHIKPSRDVYRRAPTR